VDVTPIVPPLLHGCDLENREDRTLLWGYNTLRWCWHVYIKNERLAFLSYETAPGTGYALRLEPLPPSILIPDKRLYPEACDFEFCEMLTGLGFSLPFTHFNATRQPQQYYGKTLEQLS
jgi:hypothetical protein